MRDFLLERLAEIEPASRELDIPASKVSAWLRVLDTFSCNYLETNVAAPAYLESRGPTELRESVPEVGTEFKRVMKQFWDSALSTGIQPTSGRFMGYVPGGGIATAAFADFVAALTNRYSGAYYACPGAAEIHNITIRWLIEMVNFPSTSWGTLQSGGSLANLTAVVAAREGIPFDEWGKRVIYHTGECHHSFLKALKIAGLGQCPLRQVSVDSQFRMSVESLENEILQDEKDNLIPWMICASAGTTNSGAVDPLEPLGAVAKSHNMWFHVDAAYGGFFALTDSGKNLLSGMELADSLVLDPHKGLFLPYGCGAVLVRDSEKLRSCMAFEPDYMQDIALGEESSPTDYSPELTRHFRALRLWFSIKVFGLSRFRAALEEKLVLAQYLHEHLDEIPGLAVGPIPQLSCVTFRARGKSNKPTQRLLSSLLRRGTVHLSSTRLGEHDYLRACILCFRTHRNDIDTLLSEVKNCL